MKRYGPLAAAILNGAFIHATELDDYHSVAPLHSASVLLPTLFAASEIADTTVSGASFLLAAIIGFETGPRVGNAIYGSQLLSRGWHSGPVFGSPASAAASSKLFSLSAADTESAVGIACTQADGLMSAQYEGMIMRVQHAFAARNGLFGALLARTGYVGIKKVFERPYGGFLAMFSAGNGQVPQWKIHEVTSELGRVWHTERIRVKMYACVGGCHGQVEVIEQLQKKYPERFTSEALSKISKITVWLSEPIFAHDGWLPEERPLTAAGTQMCAAYIGAVQLIERQVLLAQFADHALNRDDVWALVHKTECQHSSEFDKHSFMCGARVRVEFDDGFTVDDKVNQPKGFDPPTKNADIVGKWRTLASSAIDEPRMMAIEKAVLELEHLTDVKDLANHLSGTVGKALG